MRSAVYPAHIHNYYELYYLVEGKRQYYIENMLYSITSGTFVLIPPNTLHKTEGSSYTRILINFERSFLGMFPLKIINECFDFTVIKLFNDDRPEFEKLLNAILKCYDEPQNEKNSLLTQSLLAQLLIQLIKYSDKTNHAKNISDHSAKYPEPVFKTIAFINNNYASDIKLEEIAANIFISPWHLCRLFKKHTKLHLSEYLNNIRLNNALTLLKDPKLNISRIATMSGFSSASYLSSQLKKHIGITPSKYRKKLLRENAML